MAKRFCRLDMSFLQCSGVETRMQESKDQHRLHRSSLCEPSELLGGLQDM